MATGWRIVKSRHAGTAFDGEGAGLYGGRWNSPGTRMVYTSSTISLAVLEVLVHLQEASLLSSYSLLSVSFDDAFVERLDHSMLPNGWRIYPPPSDLQRIGDDWVRSQISVALEVPCYYRAREQLPLEPHPPRLLLRGHRRTGAIHLRRTSPGRIRRLLTIAKCEG
jgi:RES domain-containing protein